MPEWLSTMDWKFELLMAGRAAIAATLGGVIGFQRQWLGREAGIRTYAAISMGACLFSLVSLHALPQPNLIVAAGVVTGVGFLGAGTILRDAGRVVGLTTAATVWASAAIGMLVGFGMLLLAVLCAAMLLGIRRAGEIPWLRRFRAAHEHPPDRTAPPGR